MTRSAHRQKRLNKTNLTTFYETTKDTQLTTSKSAERRQKPPLSSRACVFSLLKNMFGDQQMEALADYIRAALLLAFNKRTVG